MKPITIPFAILYLRGFAIIIKYAGTAISKRSLSTFPNEDAIITHTLDSADPATSGVITNGNGEKNKTRWNRTPVTYRNKARSCSRNNIPNRFNVGSCSQQEVLTHPIRHRDQCSGRVKEIYE